MLKKEKKIELKKNREIVVRFDDQKIVYMLQYGDLQAVKLVWSY